MNLDETFYQFDASAVSHAKVTDFSSVFLTLDFIFSFQVHFLN